MRRTISADRRKHVSNARSSSRATTSHWAGCWPGPTGTTPHCWADPDRLDDLGPLPDEVTVHLDAGYDSDKNRTLGLGEIRPAVHLAAGDTLLLDTDGPTARSVRSWQRSDSACGRPMTSSPGPLALWRHWPCCRGARRAGETPARAARSNRGPRRGPRGLAAQMARQGRPGVSAVERAAGSAVGLAGMSGVQQTSPRGQLGGHIPDGFVGGGQALRDATCRARRRLRPPTDVAATAWPRPAAGRRCRS
jgi:hypothetical protein